MNYLHWDEKIISDFSERNVTDMYNKGYVFTRLGKGVMQQTRSIRIDISKFELSSENRRILKKVDDIKLTASSTPYSKYNWPVAKLAKDFYSVKFGHGIKTIIGAAKIKEILTDTNKSNFNTLLEYHQTEKILGYAISYMNNEILHYSYPFYELDISPKDMGLGMMIEAVQYAKNKRLKYVYLGSLQRPTDTYKLQFEGMEWFDGKEWKTDLSEVKKILASATPALPKHVHVIGICGVATSALAIAFHKRGVKVTGSDKGFFPPVSTELEKQGITFYAGWHPEKMVEAGVPDLIVITTASGSSNPETLYAKENGLNCMEYIKVFQKYFIRDNSIVASGTWGKTSSAALLSFILEQADFDPSYMFGGISLSHDTSAKISNSDWSVFEGDEYKSSPTDNNAKFFYYKPTHLLLSAISWDHADLYPTEEDYFNAFRKLISYMPDRGFIIANTSNKGVSEILNSYSGKIISYGKENTDYTFLSVKQSEHGLDFIVKHKNNSFQIHSPMLGSFQAENITGCFAMAHSVGIEPKQIIEAISKFQGLKRRLEKRYEGYVTIIDDIAHSPEKATSVLSTLKEIYTGKIITIFEPNIGGRKKEAAQKYDHAFKDSDTVIIPRLTKLKVSENETDQPLEGNDLALIISKTHKNCIYIDDDEKLVKFLKENTKKGDTIAFLGSHGFRGMIEATIEQFNE
jgi:UDP-N-acetylmuramate: L-alanyl-gamma-D-glutamyl-meso-diaminopimelate ligase